MEIIGFRTSMKWLDIPAHRVLEVEHQELISDFDVYDESGNQSVVGTPYLLFRRKDGKRFKLARFGDIAGSTKRNCAYLEEV